MSIKLSDLEVVKSLGKGDVHEFLLLSEVKKILGVKTDAAVKAQIRKGRIKAKRLNNGLVCSKTSVLRYMKMRDKGTFRKGGRPRTKKAKFV